MIIFVLQVGQLSMANPSSILRELKVLNAVHVFSSVTYILFFKLNFGYISVGSFV